MHFLLFMRAHGYWLVPLIAVSIWLSCRWIGSQLRRWFCLYSQKLPRALGFDWRRRFWLPLSLAVVSGCVGLVLFVATMGPVSGLALLSVELLGLCGWLLLERASQKRRFERELVPWLYGVLGLLQAGYAFPAAILEVRAQSGGPLARHLERSLREFARGRTLDECLSTAAVAAKAPRVSGILFVLARAHAQGVGLLSLLENSIAEIENDLALETRVQSCRQSALVQTGVAVLIPWGVFAFSEWVQPSEHFTMGWYCGSAGALGWQLLGVWTVWKQTEFF